MESVLDAFMLTETAAALMGIMFMGGLLWRRANRHGAAASIVAAFAVYYAMNFLMTCKLPDGPAKDLWPAVQHAYACGQHGTLVEFLGSGKLQLLAAWQGGPFGCAMLAGLLALSSSACSPRPEPAERIAGFFEKMVRSSDDPTLLATKSKVLAAELGEDMLLLDLPAG